MTRFGRALCAARSRRRRRSISIWGCAVPGKEAISKCSKVPGTAPPPQRHPWPGRCPNRVGTACSAQALCLSVRPERPGPGGRPPCALIHTTPSVVGSQHAQSQVASWPEAGGGAVTTLESTFRSCWNGNSRPGQPRTALVGMCGGNRQPNSFRLSIFPSTSLPLVFLPHGRNRGLTAASPLEASP